MRTMQFPLDKITDNIWEVPIAFSKYMRVPARIYADQQLLEAMKGDETLTQAVNIAQLPGLLKYSITLPDGHQGYGFPIGGVGAFDAEEGIITPGGVGYDINCGVRLMRTDLTYKEVEPVKEQLINEIFKLVPCGVGVGSKMRLSTTELSRAVSEGIQWAVDKGYGWDRDFSHSEEGGCMKEANPDKVSQRALKRGASQLGTLGAGNHFLEIARVSEIFDQKAAKIYGITDPDQVIVWVHTGSRGFGHQIATDYIRVMEEATRKYKIRLPARELACAPLKSREAQDYYEAMSCAINWAFINRHIIMHQVRKAFEHIFKQSAEDMGMDLVYGMTHNTAKKEEHTVDGKRVEAVVHRKGAARAFGPGRKDLPPDYKAIGQPVLLVGTMGTASYLLKGTEKGEELSFASTAHGAGRVISRSGARRRFNARHIINDLKNKGIVVKAASGRIVEEESPDSYKDVHRVAQVSHDVGLAEKVMMSVPIAVAKG
ncbi:RNA-splicing ligase RtcB [Candidatus Bathyarchaeota archaeon]|nr:MAG: RNA-splicing ligase RtcB [Candidatus Bathyarchaeota archaeon]